MADRPAALSAALDGATGTTAVHICFGYAAITHERPEGYSFSPSRPGARSTRCRSRDSALGTMRAMAGAAEVLRSEPG